MKNYIYTVKEINSRECGELALRALCSVLPQAQNITYNIENSTISFSANLKRGSKHDFEMKLSGALVALGFELITPSNVQSYTYVGSSPKRIVKIPLALATSIIALVSVFCIFLTFASCSLQNYNGSNLNGQGDKDIDVSYIDKEKELPEYIKNLAKLDEVFKAYSYDGIDEEAMAAAVLKAYIAATGDYYAEYMTAEEYEAYNSEGAGEFVGVGISIINTTVNINGYTYKTFEVISVFEDSPALESGVRVGDYIIYAGGGNDKVLVDILGYTEGLNALLGEEGTVAEFTVFRRENKNSSDFEEIDFAITRRKVITESIKSRVSETNSKVGIINITSFDQTTATQFKSAVTELKKSGCEYFVFDLRNCPGGALLSIEAVLSYFLNDGDLIVGVEYGDGQKQADYVQAKYYGSQYEGYNVYKNEIGMYKDLKSVVLVNENTASAGELFTATFRDYGLAKIVGTTTYGKGCMQTILPLDEFGLEGGLRVTTAMYFSKSYHIYHEIGIIPDYEVELNEEAYEYNFFVLPESLDAQLQKAIEVLLK